MNKTIIFDLDGTLTNLWPLEKITLIKLITKEKSASPKQVEQKLNKLKLENINDLYKLYRRTTQSKRNKKSFEEKYDQIQRLILKKKQTNKLKLFPARSALKVLQQKANLGLVTGSSKQETCFALKSLKIKKYFSKQLLVTKNDTPSPKRTGIPYLIIKRKMKGKMIVIGDGKSDELGAHRAKLEYIKVLPNNKTQWPKIMQKILAKI